MTIGSDIVEVERFKEIERDGNKLKKIFTEKEIKYFNKYKDKICHIAGTFCAKEAVAKALKVGFGKELSPIDIEILHGEKNEPFINAYNEKLKVLIGDKKIDLSISHTNLLAIAQCIIY